uniref:Uncharacterized protein n=1 Tax=Anguilla anguilla TaxID=7936 RepID=A0A0E9TXZ3_ANGAN
MIGRRRRGDPWISIKMTTYFYGPGERLALQHLGRAADPLGKKTPERREER